MAKKRPAHRSKPVTFKVDEETYQFAKDRAKKEGRSLSSVLRSFLRLWGLEETPNGFPPELPDDNVRAQKKPRQ